MTWWSCSEYSYRETREALVRRQCHRKSNKVQLLTKGVCGAAVNVIAKRSDDYSTGKEVQGALEEGGNIRTQAIVGLGFIRDYGSAARTERESDVRARRSRKRGSRSTRAK